MIKSVINLSAPRQHVYAVLADYPGYKNWVPGCEKCEIVSRSGNSADTTIVISSMKRIELGLRFEEQPGQLLSFKMTKGKDLKAYAGTYRLMDAADGIGTVVVAELDIDVGMMMPKFMVDKVARKMMDDTGAALRKFIQSAPPPAAAAPQAAKKAAPAGEPKRRRTRKIVRITKSPAGYHVWLMGETFLVKNPQA